MHGERWHSTSCPDPLSGVLFGGQRMSKDKSSKKELPNEIKYLGDCISVVDSYYTNLECVPTREGKFPELKKVTPTSGVITKDPKAREREEYDSWFDVVDNRILHLAGEFYKIYNRLKDELRPILKTNYDAFYNLEDLYWWHIHDRDGSNLLDKIQRIRNAIIELRDKKLRILQTNSKNGKTKKMRGITKKRGRKPKHPKHNVFMEILNDILKDDKNDSLGRYVIKVKDEMTRLGLKERKVDKKTGREKEDLIYKDSTIKTYIQDHTEYKIIQKRKEKRKKV